MSYTCFREHTPAIPKQGVRRFLLAALLLVCTLGNHPVLAQDGTAAKTVVFPAWSAKVTGSLKIQGVKEAASIHFWHKPEDTISWVWTAAEPGRYRVELHYSLVHTMQGGTISLTVGDQRLVVPAEPSGKWTDFRTFKLGVMGVEKGGDLPVVLQAAQLPSLPNAALPDVAWLCLTPTDAPVTPASESQASEDIELETLPTVAAVSGVIDEATAADFEKLGWKVGIQSYTFIRFSLFEAIDAASDLGLKYVEATTGQRIEPGSDQKFHPWRMSPETKRKIRERCQAKGVEIISFYYRPSKEDIEKQFDQVEEIFQFCKEMNLIWTTDPPRVKSGFGSMEFYDALCKKYGVKMVLTNHPRSKGANYWNPDDVLADLQGRSEHIGASVDIGHFMRDGIDPLEAVRKFTDAGRMYHFHFRDVDKRASDGKDVTLGDGAAQILEMLAYMKQKGVKPILLFEYERDQDKPLKYIVPSLEFLKKASSDLK